MMAVVRYTPTYCPSPLWLKQNKPSRCFLPLSKGWAWIPGIPLSALPSPNSHVWPPGRWPPSLRWASMNSPPLPTSLGLKP